MAAPGRRIFWAWLPAVLYMGLIFALSSLELHAPAVEYFPLRDKGLHALEYAVLGFLLAHAALRTWPVRALWRVASVAVVLGVGWGVLDELHQALVPYRTADALDLAADAVGTVVGVVVRVGVRAARGMHAPNA
ncbi:MAG: VanZ family protein [Myxococcota bacterium]